MQENKQQRPTSFIVIQLQERKNQGREVGGKWGQGCKSKKRLMASS